MTEDEYIEGLINQDQHSIRKFFSEFSGRVYNTALGLLQNKEDAEDITQEVFSEVFVSIRSFRKQAKISTWIYRITVTKSLELLRSRSRQKRSAIVYSLFGKEQQLNVSNNAPFYHPGVRLENKELSVVLFSAIKQLPLNQRTAFTLHKLENLSYSELADIMGISLSSVESLLFRAKKRLKLLLEKYYDQNYK